MKYNAETGPTDGERTSGYEFMKHRIRKILLVCCSYDGYILEEDGHIEQQINQEYIDLNMSNPPALLRVSSTAEALDLLREDDRFDFILTMYNVGEPDVFDFAKIVKERHRHIPVVLLTSFSKDIYRRIDERDASGIDYIFSWSGNTDLVIGIIKLIEDAMNAEEDLLTGGVQAILLVEDSVRFYSTYLPALYKLILQQNTEFLKELNEAYEAIPALEYEGHAGLADDLVRAIDENRPVLIDGEAGRATMELIMAIYKSASEGHTVDLPLAKDDPFYTREGVQAKMPHFYKKTGFLAKFEKDEIVLASSNMK